MCICCVKCFSLATHRAIRTRSSGGKPRIQGSFPLALNVAECIGEFGRRGSVGCGTCIEYGV